MRLIRARGRPGAGSRASALVAVAVLAAGVTTTSLEAQVPWKTTEWRVACTDELRQQFPNHFYCDPTSPQSAVRVAREQLEMASEWLRDVGFSGPALTFLAYEHRGDRAPQRIPPYSPADPAPSGIDPACATTYCAFVLYLPGAHGEYWRGSQTLRLDWEFMLGGQFPFNVPPSSVHRLYKDGYTPVHELFHAIQYAYDGMSSADELDWFTEGSAEYLAVVAGRKWKTLGAVIRPRRFYDVPLHMPPANADWLGDWKYGTWYFWDFVGERLPSGDGVGYLKEVLSQDLGRGNGLIGAEQGIRAAAGGEVGFYDLYPEFVRHRLDSPCFFSDLGRFRGGSCRVDAGSSHRFELRVGGASQEDSRTVSDPVSPLATEAWLVRTRVPDDAVGGLVVRLLEPFDEDARYQLVVDRTRADRPVSGMPRNHFRGVVPGGTDSVLVRVAHAPPRIDDALAAGPHQPVQLEVRLTELEGCTAEVMWNATHPVARRNTKLLPPEEYQRRFEPDPALRPAPGMLRIGGLLSDAGMSCGTPVSFGADPDAIAADPEVEVRGEEIQRRLEEMSPEEMMAMGMRLAEEMRKGAGGGELTPEAMMRGIGAAEEPLIDSLVERGSALRLFSPNALSWQTHIRTPSISPMEALQTLTEDEPVVPYAHQGVGGWSANAGADLHLTIPGVAPPELREDSTYEARGGLDYQRGEGRIVKTRGGVERPMSEDWSPDWQLLEGWHEWLRSDWEAGVQPLSGEVTITRVTGAAVHGTFSLSGPGRLRFEECPENPSNRRSVQEQCRQQEGRGEVQVSGTFISPSAHITRRGTEECRIPPCEPPAPEECTGPACEDPVPEEPEPCEGADCPPEPPPEERPQRGAERDPAEGGPGGAPRAPPAGEAPGDERAPTPAPGAKPAPGVGATEAAGYLEFAARPKRLKDPPEIVSGSQPVAGRAGMETLFVSDSYRLRVQPQPEDLDTCALPPAPRQAVDGLRGEGAGGRLEARLRPMEPALQVTFGPVGGWTLRVSASGDAVDVQSGRDELRAAVRGADLELEGPPGENGSCPGLLEFELRAGERP